jgi:hypothetical protein
MGLRNIILEGDVLKIVMLSDIRPAAMHKYGTLIEDAKIVFAQFSILVCDMYKK